MSDKTGIEWTDATWNPVTGCAKVSQGCKHCYAEREWPRMTKLVPAYAGRDFTDVRTHGDRLDQPIRWAKRRMIFVNSMSDLFHPEVPDDFIDSVFGVMWACLYGRNEQDGHIFQVLTKRAERMLDYFKTDRREEWARAAVNHGGGIDPDGLWDQTMNYEGPHPRIWLGVSVEDQAAADERIPLLLETPAAVRWISAEPLLGPVDLSRWIEPTLECAACSAQYGLDEKVLDGDGYHWGADKCARCGNENIMGTVWGHKAAEEGCPDGQELDQWDHGYKLHWVVAGGESGPKARPMHPDWARSLRDQCQAAGVPFIFKQWGEWAPQEVPCVGARKVPSEIMGGELICRVGKKAAGRLLDGVQHDGYPKGGVA